MRLTSNFTPDFRPVFLEYIDETEVPEPRRTDQRLCHVSILKTPALCLRLHVCSFVWLTFFYFLACNVWDFLGGVVVKNLPGHAEDARDVDSIPG